MSIEASPIRQPVATEPSRGLVLAMACAAGAAVANIYYNQPMLGIMQRDLGPGMTAMVPTVTQLGYALGLLLLVPLGDIVPRRKLIVAQFVALAVGLGAIAAAPTGATVVLASLLVGLLATAAQQIVPFAAHLATSERRGAVVGTVMSGLLAGILLSRTVAGFVADAAGWREMYVIGVLVALAAAVVMAMRLPFEPVQPGLRYLPLIRSLETIWRAHPVLRHAAATQALLFAAFSAFWTVLVLRLSEPAFGLGAGAAGLFGLIGVAGVVAAPLAGKTADRHGPERVVLAGAALTLLSWVVFGAWTSLAGLVAGVIVLDFAVQGALVSNQHIIFALGADIRARVTTLFMGTMFLGGALGSAVGSLAYHAAGWSAVCLAGVVLSGIATLMQIRRGTTGR